MEGRSGVVEWKGGVGWNTGRRGINGRERQGKKRKRAEVGKRVRGKIEARGSRELIG